MKNKIGVMEGRLLPKYKGRYQAHPVDYWQDEFGVAKELGLDCIEFILDYNDAEQNPLLKAGGIDELQNVIEQTGVAVYTVCADYFMEAPLHSEDNAVADQSQKVMLQLLENSEKLGISDVVVPCVDQSTLDGKEAANRFVERMKPMVTAAEKHGINLSLEADLTPQPFVDLLDRIINELSGLVQVIIKPHPIVSVKYVYDLFGEFVGEDDVSLFDGDLYDVLSTSNLLISNASGTLIDSIAMGIPAVLFSIPGKFLHNPIPEEFPSELWELCRSSSMVVDYIKGLIDEADDGVDRREYLAKNIRSNYYEPVTREGVLGLLGFED